jgi:DNA-binding NtrC family response regulator
LEAGEFIRVGSSKVQKTDVRVIAATNKDLLQLTDRGKFREDLYYRLSTVPIRVPSLRDRKEDIPLLFRKFAVDFAERYKTSPVQLDEDAKNLLIQYGWPGNVRELKNIAEQISVLSQDKTISQQQLRRFIPENQGNRLPMVMPSANNQAPNDFSNEREILYKLFFDMRKDVTELKKMFLEILKNPSLAAVAEHSQSMKELKPQDHYSGNTASTPYQSQPVMIHNNANGNNEISTKKWKNPTIMDKERTDCKST